MFKIATSSYHQYRIDNAIYAQVGRREIKVARKTSVPLKGTLRQQDNGWVYVDISNDVIHGLYSIIADDEVQKPPYFNSDGVGAHISAIHESELGDKKFTDQGKEVQFTFEDFVSVEPEGWEDMKRVYFVEVNCPDLEKIRRKYDLPKTYKGMGHKWHITVAVKNKE